MRKQLYLFDIDGTLITPGPSARQTLNKAFVPLLGRSPDLQIADVAGLTDLVIIRNTLQKFGVDGHLDEKVATVLNTYLANFEQAYLESDQAEVYQDALVLLERIESAGHSVALLTGNVRRGAKIKLSRFGLFERFPFGVFGDDGDSRIDLPQVARQIAWESLQESFRYEDMVIVGDTVHDARVANAYQAQSIIVCRRPEWREEIATEGTDVLVDRLDDPSIEIQPFEEMR